MVLRLRASTPSSARSSATSVASCCKGRVMALVDIKVPDIGDFDEVAVIELLVKPGDTVKPEQSLITVESDKASMEIPSSHGGVVKELKVKLGDKVSEGWVVLVLEASEGAAAPAAAAAAPAPAAAPAAAPVAAPTAASFGGTADLECDVLVLGAGPGGYSAAFRAADLGLKVVIVERYATLGGVCLNVGCIPSKALLHVAAVMDEVSHMADLGVAFGEPTVDYDTLLDAQHLKVEATEGTGQAKTGSSQTVAFKRLIVAAGSQAVRLPFLPKDPRIIDSTGALEMEVKPQKMLIVGGGIIGLEMGTVYSTLGARLDVVEMLPTLMTGADRDLVKVWQKFNQHRFDNIMLNTKTVAAEAKPDRIYLTFEGEGAPKEPQRYDLVLQAVGRTPNGKKIAAENAGVIVGDRGFISVDVQMRTNVPSVFAIGDIVGQPMLAHKAVHEGHVAAEVIAGEVLGDEAVARTEFYARVIPVGAYTSPEGA